MPRNARSTHLFTCGSTGTGKSKFLEHLIRQDILAWSTSKCGVLLLDPHGSLYDSLIRWLAWHGIKRPVTPIDLRQSDWVIAYNVLRQRSQCDPAVLVSNFVQAMAYVWGENGTERTPRFNRWASNVLRALYEKGHTLVEAQYLIDLASKRIRTLLTQDLPVRALAQDWAFANALTFDKFDTQVGSTINRLHAFVSTELLRLMFGQIGPSLDLGKAIEEGHIILVSLATEKALITKEDAALFATLLLSDLWTAASERGKGTDERQVKPFYVYIDEFQNFITPTIAKNLDEARGFGLHLTLANQFPRQILHAGAHGQQVYDSIMANARSKLVFETRGEENLRPLALDLFMGVIDPNEIKLKLYSRKVMDYVEEMRISRGRSETDSEAAGEFSGTTGTESDGGSEHQNPDADARLWNRSTADSRGASRVRTSGSGTSETEAPFLRPVMGEELSHVQFRSLEEQLFRAMAVLFDQKQQHCVVRLVGSEAPVSLITPTIRPLPGSPERRKRYLDVCYQQSPFALTGTQAQKQIVDRERQFVAGLQRQSTEPDTAKRRIK